VYGAVEDDTGTVVVFDSTGTVEEVVAFLTAEITGMGYTEASNSSVGDVVAAEYTNDTTSIALLVTSYTDTTSGTITISPKG
jgi:hypothetical protein